MKSESNTERWKDIAGFEFKYQVSNMGRVRSLPHISEYINRWGGTSRRSEKGKILAQQVCKNGYHRIKLTRDGSRHETYLVHRLVAAAFIPNQESKPEVNHKDENPGNNRADNLEWVSHEENINYGTHNQKAARWMDEKKVKKAVVQMTLDGEEIARYSSQTEAARVTGISLQGISHACKGIYKQMKGYKWRYV